MAFNEVSRVLKAEGFIIVGLIDKDSMLGKEYEENKSESKFYKNANFYSKAKSSALTDKSSSS